MLNQRLKKIQVHLKEIQQEIALIISEMKHGVIAKNPNMIFNLSGLSDSINTVYEGIELLVWLDEVNESSNVF